MSVGRVFQTQVTSITATITSATAGGPYTRVVGISFLTSGTGGGHYELKDGSTAGTVRITESVPGVTNIYSFIRVPGDGVRFENGIFASCAAGITLGIWWA